MAFTYDQWLCRSSTHWSLAWGPLGHASFHGSGDKFTL